MNTVRATLIGIGAVLLWAMLALFTDATGAIPPLQLTAMSFAVAFLIAIGLWIAKGQNPLRRIGRRAHPHRGTIKRHGNTIAKHLIHRIHNAGSGREI